MNKDNQEIEIKIKLTDRNEFTAGLEKVGAKKLEEFFSRDVMYDNGKGFFDAHQVLRIRTYGDGRDGLLTYKERMDQHEHAHLLKRTEIETRFKDAKAMDEILQKLGYFPYRIKEKKQINYELNGLVIEVHTLPLIGDFIEIEATEERLNEILPKIGFSMTDGINEDYSKLFFDFCDKNQLSREVPHTFEEEQKYLSAAGLHNR